jgi:hypothetical protein
MMKYERFWRKLIYFEVGLLRFACRDRKPTRSHQGSKSLHRDSNPRPPEHDSGVLHTASWCLVTTAVLECMRRTWRCQTESNGWNFAIFILLCFLKRKEK